jgi:hypothetical protein
MTPGANRLNAPLASVVQAALIGQPGEPNTCISGWNGGAVDRVEGIGIDASKGDRARPTTVPIQREETMAETTAGASTASGGPELIRIRRDRDRDMEFQGWRIGSGETGTGPADRFGHPQAAPDRERWIRGIEVTLFRTVGGQFAVGLRRWGPGGEEYHGVVHRSPEELLEWMKSDAGGKLGAASKQAWESACRLDPDLKAHETERIE